MLKTWSRRSETADFGKSGPKPYKVIGFGDIHGPKPYKFIGLRAAAGTATTKIDEIRNGSSCSAESPTEFRFVTAYFGPSGKRDRAKPYLCRGFGRKRRISLIWVVTVLVAALTGGRQDPRITYSGVGLGGGSLPGRNRKLAMPTGRQ